MKIEARPPLQFEPMARFLCPTCGDPIANPTQADGRAIRCSTCGEVIQYAMPLARAVPALAVARPLNMRSKGGPGAAVGVIAGVVVLVLIMAAVARLNVGDRDSTASREANAPPTEKKTPREEPESKPSRSDEGRETNRGQVYQIEDDDGFTFGFVDYESKDQFVKYAGAKDKAGMVGLIVNGKAIRLADGTSVRIIMNQIFSVEVRVVDGHHAGRELILMREIVKFRK